MSFLKCHLSKLPAPSDNVVICLLSLGLAMDLYAHDVVAMLSTCKYLNSLMDYLVVTKPVQYRKASIPHRPHFACVQTGTEWLPIINGEIKVPLEVTSLVISEETLIDDGCLLAPETYGRKVFTQVHGIGPGIQSITELEIAHCTIGDLSILKCFPNLQKLTLSFSYGDDDGPYPLLMSTVDLPNLVELDVMDCGEFDFRLLLESAPGLKKISIYQSRAKGLIHAGVTEFRCVEYDLDLAGLTGLRTCHYSTYDAIEAVLIENVAKYIPTLRELYVTAGELHGQIEPLDLEVFELKITN